MRTVGIGAKKPEGSDEKLKKEIKELKKENSQLKKENKDLRARVETLEKPEKTEE